MVFAGVSASGITPLFFVEKTARIDKNVYLEILKNHLLPWATERYENGDWILQQDGTPANRAESTQDWCLANLPDFISASEWPANSPDLNGLDFSIWAMLEQKACQKKHTSVQDLRKSMEKAWNEVSLDHVRAAVEAYLSHICLKAIIRTKGDHIE
ncbi:hypothetical protein Y032_0014g2240 [Ancylostoma ceylanicum]|uniref:Tc1-like transposase DDE domain-containing protein n=1 Tax=Ancylostoma ceylanicum TaxID=53326 RepID=A0A016VAC4_9BILA|nr:hypothetical protein Y032_0014g2240 [Ancylostoma ceylanicum]